MRPSTRTRRTSAGSRLIPVGSLSPEAFAPFGQVIQNPATHSGLPKLDHAVANQGSATKWLDVTSMTNHYDLAASRKAGNCVVNMFVCEARELKEMDGRIVFDVKILERHPFTPQTFIPLGLSSEDRGTRYLIIVAPTLPSRSWDESSSRRPPYPIELPRQSRRSLKERLLGARPNPFTNDYASSTTPSRSGASSPSSKPKGPGPPDLDNLQAFIARGDQAVTYGPGTWHTPMVVLGEKPLEFVVVQYANGVASEDCQEFEIEVESGSFAVELSDGVAEAGQLKAKL